MRRRTPIESGLARYVRTADGFVELGVPPIVPTSQARFARSRPLPTPIQPVPLYAAKEDPCPCS